MFTVPHSVAVYRISSRAECNIFLVDKKVNKAIKNAFFQDVSWVSSGIQKDASAVESLKSELSQVWLNSPMK